MSVVSYFLVRCGRLGVDSKILALQGFVLYFIPSKPILTPVCKSCIAFAEIKTNLMHIKSATFVMSNSDVAKCPKEKLAEYAFIGRSNVGKSSLINMLTNRKSLAKTSGRPGKTRRAELPCAARVQVPLPCRSRTAGRMSRM